MKNNLENLFKKSLEGYEEPYDPKAWEGVNARLKSAGSTGLTVQFLKWGLVGAVVVGIGVGIYALLPTNKSTELAQNQNKTTLTQDSPRIEKTKKEKGDIGNVESSNNSEKISNSQREKIIENTKPDNTKKQALNKGNKDFSGKNNGTKQNTGNTMKTLPAYQHNEVEKTNNSSKPKTGGTNKQEKPKEAIRSRFIAGVVSNTAICQGQNITISNPNTNSEQLVRFQTKNGQMVTLHPGEKYILQPNTSMSISFVDKSNHVIAKRKVAVHSLPRASFSYKSNVFKDGLPITICKLDNNAKSIVWSADKRSTQKEGEEATFHFFKKGKHQLHITITDNNGCKETVSKTVHVTNQYNLLAVDAFRPNSADERTQSFMPYALKVRPVDFTLTIIDPKDNHVVFTSKSADHPWKGEDQATGKMAPQNKIYIWKVNLKNPLPNERPIYVGTVVIK